MRLLATVLLLLAPLAAVAAERAVPFEGKTADGSVVRFDPERLERPAILFFWATWCGYCKVLMPHVQAVHDAAGPGKLDVYAIDIHESGDPVATLRAGGYRFTPVHQGEQAAKAYGIQGTPGLLLVAKDGSVAYRRLGSAQPAEVQAELRRLLGLPPPA